MTRINQSDVESSFLRRARKIAPNFFSSIDNPPPPNKPLTPDEQAAIDEEYRVRMLEESTRDENRRIANFIAEVGSRYELATLENYQTPTESQKRALAAIKVHSEGINAFAENIVLYGPCGSGKDHLLIGLAKLAIKKNFAVKWVFGVDLFRSMRDAIGQGLSEQDTIASLVRPDILILSDPAPPDDAVTTHQRCTLLSILDQRYRFCKPTWSTINATGREDAEERLGGQSVDRLWTDANQILVYGPSFRKLNQ